MVSIEGYAPVTVNHPELLRKMLPTLAWAAGDDKLIDGAVVMGAEDFSFFQERIPGLFLHLCVYDPSNPRSDRPANHTPFINADDAALITGVITLVGFAKDYASVAAD